MNKLLNILLVGALILSNTSALKVKQIGLSLGGSANTSTTGFSATQSKISNSATTIYNNGIQALKDSYTATKTAAKSAYDAVSQDNVDAYVNAQAAAEAAYNAGVAAYKDTYARGKVDSEANARIANEATTKALSSLTSVKVSSK